MVIVIYFVITVRNIRSILVGYQFFSHVFPEIKCIRLKTDLVIENGIKRIEAVNNVELTCSLRLGCDKAIHAGLIRGRGRV